MTKIVINRCYGGFGLSHEAVLAYCARKSMPVFPERDRFGYWKYWLHPDGKSSLPYADREWSDLSIQEKQEQNEAYEKIRLYPRDIDRTDAHLVAVVEALGDAANAYFAKLEVVEIPDDIEWSIEGYDGGERVQRLTELGD